MLRLFSDFETWMAQELGVFHTGHHWGKQNKWKSVSKQYDHSKIAQWRSFRLFIRSNDPDQSQTFEGNVFRFGRWMVRGTHSLHPTFISKIYPNFIFSISGHHVLTIFTSFWTLPICVGQFTECSVGRSNPWNASSFFELDSTGLYFRNETHYNSHI